jgi:hypothetical protein
MVRWGRKTEPQVWSWREGLFERRFVYSCLHAIAISEIANPIHGMKKMTHMQEQTASNEREVNE